MIAGLYATGNRLTTDIYRATLRLTRNGRMSMSVTTLFLFPGTIVHELAHLFTAEILGVHTGKLSLAPDDIREYETESERGTRQGFSMAAGSVMVAKTDPIRRTLIGIAPLVVGLPTLTIISYYALPYVMTILDRLTKGSIPGIAETSVMIGSLWAIIAVSASIFPSPEDMHGVWPVIITLVLFTVPLFFFQIIPQVPTPLVNISEQIIGRLIEGVRLSLFSHVVVIALLWRLR